ALLGSLPKLEPAIGAHPNPLISILEDRPNPIMAQVSGSGCSRQVDPLPAAGVETQQPPLGANPKLSARIQVQSQDLRRFLTHGGDLRGRSRGARSRPPRELYGFEGLGFGIEAAQTPKGADPEAILIVFDQRSNSIIRQALGISWLMDESFDAEPIWSKSIEPRFHRGDPKIAVSAREQEADAITGEAARIGGIVAKVPSVQLGPIEVGDSAPFGADP
ncbi:hypothetical protein AC249_AIPGENE16622, partial [Exaiptasia diaphana]